MKHCTIDCQHSASSQRGGTSSGHASSQRPPGPRADSSVWYVLIYGSQEENWLQRRSRTLRPAHSMSVDRMRKGAILDHSPTGAWLTRSDLLAISIGRQPFGREVLPQTTAGLSTLCSGRAVGSLRSKHGSGASIWSAAVGPSSKADPKIGGSRCRSDVAGSPVDVGLQLAVALAAAGRSLGIQ